jgi:hypothetical protein
VDSVFGRLTSVMPSFMVFLRTLAILTMSASFSVLYMV